MSSGECPFRSEPFRKPAASYPLGGKAPNAADQLLSEGVAFQGTPEDEVFLNARELHWRMRRRYQPMIEQVGRKLFPVIISLDNEAGHEGHGGVYVLRRADGETHRIKPVPREYELLKAVCHSPLGMFTHVGPYLRNPHTRAFTQDLEPYLVWARTTLASLDRATATNDERVRKVVKDILSALITFGEGALANGVCADRYREFTRPLIPTIKDGMFYAAEIQMKATVPALRKWRDELLTEDEWRRVYCIVNTIWPVAVDSPREQALRLVMNPDMVEERLLIGEGCADVEESLTLLGRVVADRALARLVFNDYEENEVTESLVHSLSSPRDVVADGSYAVIEELISEQKVGNVDMRNIHNPTAISRPFQRVQ